MAASGGSFAAANGFPSLDEFVLVENGFGLGNSVLAVSEGWDDVLPNSVLPRL